MGFGGYDVTYHEYVRDAQIREAKLNENLSKLQTQNAELEKQNLDIVAKYMHVCSKLQDVPELLSQAKEFLAAIKEIEDQSIIKREEYETWELLGDLDQAIVPFRTYLEKLEGK